MPSYLIRLNNKRTWDRDGYREWLGAMQVPADVLGDFRARNGRLSIWHIEDDEANLEQVITAIAVTRQQFDTFDYGLFDQSLLAAVPVAIEITPGDTPLHNARHWHRDLVELTVDNFAALVTVLFDSMVTSRKQTDEFEALIIHAVQARDVDLSAVNKGLRKHIQASLDNP